jgi:hypothetical protein
MIKDQMAADYSIREQIDGKNILSLTLKHYRSEETQKKGQGTVNRLRMNDAPQIEVRKHWIELGLYP